ncbi:PLP-dependent aminotransferase family protein [Subtercola sp. RTI3]|uniref:aminotransferase-like domain-containing protein n=1 Tax=Subtercola sp. RTI3 TaxID=3048639 RepID=UPI002B23674B|nr:PLP-dependent aminotransferase family protein [Subtercola sp. RTI3]MEA9983927.1 PLP-dependent aminotransferase family protein [Subtercola sp. RTI3]
MTALHLSARALDQLLGDWKTGASTYSSLADRIRLLVLDGRIPAGSRLPAERELSARLTLSRSTIGAAYAELRASGFLRSVRGSGSIAQQPAPGSTGTTRLRRPEDPPTQSTLNGSADSYGSVPSVPSAPSAAFAAFAETEQFATAWSATGWSISSPDRTAGNHTARNRTASEIPATPSLLNFTQAALPAIAGVAEAFAASLDDLTAQLATPGFEPFGLQQLRQAIADRYAERGLPTHPDEILVTSGALQGLNLIARTLLSRGDRVVVETPTYPHAADALVAAGARLVPVAVTAGEGWHEDAMLQAFARTAPALAFLMPDFQNPTGESMGNDMRHRLVEAAERSGTVIVADETTAELNIDREGEFANLASLGDVVLLGSASKTMWGGLRIGWVRASRPLIRRLLIARASVDVGTPILEQLVATRLVPQTTALVALRREQLRFGRDTLHALLAERLPEWSVPHLHGGLCSWVNLGRPVSSQLALSVRTRGVLMNAGPRFGLDGAFERFMRIPLSYSPAETERAVDALQHAWLSLDARAATPDPSVYDMV